ncbi:hypothetical protein J4E91_005137 [Alternaria rosae]|uniref:uncharacterized protein n=1 Tax=Alternaria rosae TaxID=1187941 RepID=UPI001E8EB8D9|nr:uncharacterized protein BKA58DRAFT_6770 [Alternaria rosae]KAH6881698.1 hypothetical protein BKA58DRAFT_6770 [Alternaria rosae]KAI4949398.1 hypothetical protein J4E91_005137 [Alternaria rosae]
MVNVAVTSQLKQWTFDKPAVVARPQRSSTDSAASSPNLCDDAPDTLRIDSAPAQTSSPSTKKQGRVFQERYLSSEEDLTADDASASESEYDYDDVVVHDLSHECKARTMSVSRWDKGKSCDMAVLVSYANAGRPKVVEVDCRSPVDRPTVQQRSASVANLLPITTASKLRKADEAQRLSMKVMPTSRPASPPLSRSTSPVADPEPRRPSTSHSPITQKPTTYPDSASFTSSFQTGSSRSFSPAPSEAPRRPSTSARSSVYVPTKSRLDLSRIQTSQSSYQSSYRQSQFAPLTPQSPALSFLSSDPYENQNKSAASPIIKKPAAHRRLRSISMKLSLAKIAISPAKKPYDSRINGRAPGGPTTPMTPAPMTPMTAPIQGTDNFSSPNKLRRASTILRPKSRGSESKRTPTPETAPPVPQLSTMQQKRSTTMGRMTARGANEREPTLVIPEFLGSETDDATSSIKSRAIRRRKSLMDFMDSL